MKLFKKFRKFFEKNQTAITFAEANELDYAIEEAERIEKQNKTTLLVVGRKAGFSKEIIEYALDMANRMSYDILALNTAPLSCETFKMLSHRNKACDEFKQIAEENASLFEQAAAEKGIAFSHVVMFDAPEEAIMTLCGASSSIAFVVSETIEDRDVSRIEGDRPTNKLFVYSMV